MNWNEEDIEFLKANYNKMTYSQIGNIIDKSTISVNKKALRLNLKTGSRNNMQVIRDKISFSLKKKGQSSWNKGKHHSENTKYKIGLANLKENPSYGAIHTWIRNHKFKSELCECCKKVPPRDLANISGEYKRDINDFEWLCRRCHMTKDGRLNHLKHIKKYRRVN